MAIRKIVRFICFALIFSPIPFPAAADENRWWPVQAMPKGLVRLQNDLPAPRASCDMMAQSLAGLAAKAVNEGRADEMVWVGTDNSATSPFCRQKSTMVKLSGGNQVDRPNGYSIPIPPVVRAVIVVPAASPNGVVGINHRRAFCRLAVAIGEQDIHPVIVAVGWPLAVALTVICRIDVGVHIDQVRIGLRSDVRQHDHVNGFEHVRVSHWSSIRRTVHIATQTKLGEVADGQAPIVIAKRKTRMG